MVQQKLRQHCNTTIFHVKKEILLFGQALGGLRAMLGNLQMEEASLGF